MKRMIGGLLLLGLAMVPLSVTAAPQIWAEETEASFGVVIEGESVELTFTLENRGDEVLTIDNIHTGCGCTVARLDSEALAPGESTLLKLTFRTKGYGGQVVSRAIRVYSDDPETPELVLFIKGTVEEDPLCQVEPSDFMARYYVLIDLREPAEYAKGHLIGATNIPLPELASWIEYLPPRVSIMLYDADGSTVYSALEQLIVSGIEEACGLAGGLSRWVESYGTSMVVSFKLLPGEL